MKCEMTATVVASNIHGIHASLDTTKLSLRSASGSRPIPALHNITTKAMLLQANQTYLNKYTKS